MPNVLDRERAKYDDLWLVDVYRENSPGEQLVPVFLDMAKTLPGQTVLDAGCGEGRGAVALASRGFIVDCCDFSDAGYAAPFKFERVCLWEPMRQLGLRDWVYCTDVLEHVPPTFAMLVVSRLLEVAVRGLFLSISLVPDRYGVYIGETLHETVQSFVAWRDQLSEIGRVVEARDLIITGCYMVEPR